MKGHFKLFFVTGASGFQAYEMVKNNEAYENSC